MIFPARTEHFRYASATFGETRVTHLSVGDQNTTTGLFNGSAHIGIVSTRHSLVTLTMVVGTNIIQRVSSPVSPIDSLVIRQQSLMAHFCLLAFATLNLGQQPAATDNGRSLQVFQAGRSLHLTTDDADQIVFHRQFVDSCQCAILHYHLE